MKWAELLKEFSDQPLFHSSMLRIFDDVPAHIEVQLSRWSRSGKLCRIRRSWYLIEEPYRARDVSEAVIANSVVQPSYLSLDWALGFYGLIPEAIFNPTSITTARGIEFEAEGRRYFYHHVQPIFFTGYEKVEGSGDVFIIAAPEKALLDKIYITMRNGEFSAGWLKSLRLQNLKMLDEVKLKAWASLVSKPGFAAAADTAAAYIRENQEE
jgi:hypothetical protein